MRSAVWGKKEENDSDEEMEEDKELAGGKGYGMTRREGGQQENKQEDGSKKRIKMRG